MTVLYSGSTDPVYNLACENYLHGERSEDYLFIYRNSPSVIIGRNQCARAEVNLKFCRDRGIAVLRRLSGGGTVYHDEGNINYSFLTTGVWDGGEKALSTVIGILGSMGINAAAGARKELLLDGRKISGTASFCRGGRTVFHGTLLYDTGLETLSKALTGDSTLRGRKIASVPSPVINISEHMGCGQDAQGFMDRFITAACQITGAPSRNMEAILPSRENAIIEKFSPEIIPTDI